MFYIPSGPTLHFGEPSCRLFSLYNVMLAQHSGLAGLGRGAGHALLLVRPPVQAQGLWRGRRCSSAVHGGATRSGGAVTGQAGMAVAAKLYLPQHAHGQLHMEQRTSSVPKVRCMPYSRIIVCRRWHGQETQALPAQQLQNRLPCSPEDEVHTWSASVSRPPSRWPPQLEKVRRNPALHRA